jgi:4-amino-4-deoxy-L-arabinose transferase-like glycosyltransferase
MTTTPSGARHSYRWVLVPTILVSAWMHLWGIQRDLPLPQWDERYFVDPAVYMASSGDPNPHWFGHPGSTVIYPLAVLYRLRALLFDGAPLFGRAPSIAVHFANDPTAFYLMGRIWAVGFSLAAFPLIYAIGRRVFNELVGVTATVVWAIVPIAVDYGRIVRTDSVALFFALLCLWACVRAVETPTASWFVAAGVAAGLGMASRYFLAALAAVVVAAWLVTHPRRRTTLGAGLGAMAAAFALSTPFVFLDPREALRSIGGEAGSPDPGRSSDFVGNLAFYALHAIPGALSWIGLAAAIGGIVLALRHRTPRKLLLLVWIATLVVGMSVLPFHWDRWLIPALPMLLLFAVDALIELARHLARRTALRTHWNSRVTFVSVLGASLVLTVVGPADALVHLDQTESRPSTRTVAQSWIEHHLAHGSGIAVEVQGPVLPTTKYRTVEHHLLPTAGTVGDYARAGYRYLVLDAGLDRTYVDRAQQYPNAVTFLRFVQKRARVVADFRPSRTHPGPHLTVYDIGTGRGPAVTVGLGPPCAKPAVAGQRLGRVGSSGGPIPIVQERLLRLQRCAEPR